MPLKRFDHKKGTRSINSPLKVGDMTIPDFLYDKKTGKKYDMAQVVRNVRLQSYDNIDQITIEKYALVVSTFNRAFREVISYYGRDSFAIWMYREYVLYTLLYYQHTGRRRFVFRYMTFLSSYYLWSKFCAKMVRMGLVAKEGRSYYINDRFLGLISSVQELLRANVMDFDHEYEEYDKHVKKLSQINKKNKDNGRKN